MVASHLFNVTSIRYGNIKVFFMTEAGEEKNELKSSKVTEGRRGRKNWENKTYHLKS